MREKTQKNLFDNLMWYLLYLLPIVIWLAVSFRTGNMVTLSTAMSSIGLEIFSNNQIFTSLMSIFAVDGILPLFVTSDIILYMSYFIVDFATKTASFQNIYLFFIVISNNTIAIAPIKIHISFQINIFIFSVYLV